MVSPINKMKKPVFFVFIFLLCIPLASASLLLQSLPQTKFNIGDTVMITGEILENQTGPHLLKLTCGENILYYKMISLEKETKKDFSIPITFQSIHKGECSINGELSFDNNIIATATTTNIMISDELDGNFQVDKQQLQLGETVKLTATVNKFSGETFAGTALVMFQQGEKTILAEQIDFDNSQFEYVFNSENYPAGDYNVDIFISNVGNAKLFEDIVAFTVVDEIKINATASPTTAKQGDKIKISGKIEAAIEKQTFTTQVKLAFQNITEEKTLLGSSFDFTLKLPKQLKPKNYNIYLTATDSLGNKGEIYLPITIIQTPARISVDMETSELYPDQTAVITTILLDQIDDIIEGEDIDITVLSPEKEVLVSKSTDKPVKVALAKFAPPGLYTIKASYPPLISQTNFTVLLVEKASLVIQEGRIFLTNIGNIPFTDTFTITLIGSKQNYTFERETYIKVEGVSVIDLTKEVVTDSYAMSISSKEKSVETIDDGYIVQVSDIKSSLNKKQYVEGEDPEGEIFEESQTISPQASTITETKINIVDNRSIFKKWWQNQLAFWGSLFFLLVIIALTVYMKNPQKEIIKRTETKKVFEPKESVKKQEDEESIVDKIIE